MFSILCNVSTSNIDEINKEYLLNHVKRPFVSITTATYNLLCLVDTGAGASCLSAKAFQNLPKSAIKRKLAIPHGFSLKSAGGTVLHTVGRYEVEFKLLHRTVRHDFFVIQGLLSNGILGVDFISRQKLVIWGQGRVTKCAFLDQINGILQKSTAINNISTETPIQHDQPFITAASTMTAPAHTVTKVDVNILNMQHQGPETQICAESTQDADFDIIDGLVKVQNGKSFVLVVNNSDDTLTIDKGEYLANATTFNHIEAIHEIKTAKHDDELAKTIHLNTNPPNSQNERWERIKAQLDIKHLSPNVAGKYTSLFRKYADIFSVHKYDILHLFMWSSGLLSGPTVYLCCPAVNLCGPAVYLVVQRSIFVIQRSNYVVRRSIYVFQMSVKRSICLFMLSSCQLMWSSGLFSGPAVYFLCPPRIIIINLFLVHG